MIYRKDKLNIIFIRNYGISTKKKREKRKIIEVNKRAEKKFQIMEDEKLYRSMVENKMNIMIFIVCQHFFFFCTMNRIGSHSMIVFPVLDPRNSFA